MPAPDAGLPFDEAAFDARAAELGLTLSPDERLDTLAVARFLHDAAERVRRLAHDPTQRTQAPSPEPGHQSGPRPRETPVGR